MHLLDTLRWSREAEVRLADCVAAGLAMAVPVLIGGKTGHIGPAFAVALGGLAFTGAGSSNGTKAKIAPILEALAPAGVAAVLGVLVAGHGRASDLYVVVVAGIAATVSGYSRAMAAATMRFIPIFLIVVSVAETAPQRGGVVLMVGAGLVWAGLLGLAVGLFARVAGDRAGDAASPPRPQPTARQKYVRWKRSLATLSGWNYPARLVFCLAIAGLLRHQWPDHHLHWIALTVALVLPRRMEILPVRITQRSLGTAVGVVVAQVLAALRPTGLALAVMIGILAGLRPFLRARNYLAYSVVMTPLVILILDAGRPPEGRLLVDRLIATLIGACLVMVANLAAIRLMGAEKAG